MRALRPILSHGSVDRQRNDRLGQDTTATFGTTLAADIIPARRVGQQSTTNAPDTRYLHTAVWTGSEMIVWGGDRREIP